jgi:FKBP-type peptidyl-prolyl cis-trans isomerase FklB
MDKLSYAVGVLIAQNLQQQGLTVIEAPDLAAAVTDVLAGGDLKMSIEDANQILETHMKSQAASQYGDSMVKGQKFLEENSKREEITTLESGLQYEVINQGFGPKPKSTDKVTTHYHGTLMDGTVFDSSYKRGEPASFPVNGVILGWQEALQLMPVGSKWRLYVPYNLAYGEQGAGGAIKPFSTLIFDVELLSIN